MLVTKILGAVALLALTTAIAAAAPATVRSSANVRAGPGTNYPVVATLPPGSVVDVEGCTGSWCQVEQGYVARSLLRLAGTPPAVAAAPVYQEEQTYFYDDDPSYYPGYAYGPGVGIYVPPRWHRRHPGWHRPPGWAGRPPRGPGWAGNPPAGGPPPGVNPGIKPKAAFGQTGAPGFAGGVGGGFRGGMGGGGFRGGVGGGGIGAGGMRGGGSVGAAPAARAAGGGIGKK
jgi:SH3 domain-containing protein